MSELPHADFSSVEALSSCNLCGSRQLEDIYPSVWVRRCRDCGHTFRSPRPTAEAISRFYSREGKYEHWFGALEGRERCFQYRLQILRRFVSSGRLLDVGAGVGEFVLQAGEWFEASGLEVSDEAIRAAREQFGVEVLKGALDESPALAAGSFDVVSMIHVLEHVPDPADTITRCRELLRAGGWLFIAVPNDSPTGRYKSYHGARRMLQRLAKRRFSEITYDETPPFDSVELSSADPAAEIHLSYFSPESLRALLSCGGFEVVHLGPDPCYTTSGLRRLPGDLDFHAWRLFHSVAGVFCYQTMLMVARSRP